MNFQEYCDEWDLNSPRRYGKALTMVHGKFGRELVDDYPMNSLRRQCWRNGDAIPGHVFLLAGLQIGAGAPHVNRADRPAIMQRRADRLEWLTDNATDLWAAIEHQIAIYSDEDAMLFRLTWGDD